MKRLTLIMLVAMIPFFTMGQKRSKKSKSNTNKSLYEFMVITGFAMMDSLPEDEMKDISPDQTAELQAKFNMNANIMVVFDFGGSKSDENSSLSENRYTSMAHAVNSAARYGWEFVNANVTSEDNLKIHYYYMKRSK